MRLTPLGKGMLTATVLLYVAGWALGWVELAVLAMGCTLALVVSLLWVAAQPKLQVRREVMPDRVARGNPALAVLTVDNADRRPCPALTAIERCGPGERSVAIPRLAPGASRTVTYRLPTERRGLVEVGPLHLIHTDPFGLVHRGQTRDERAALWVHPLTQPIAPLPSGQVLHLEGPATDMAPNGSITFHALREYVVGDDLRHVHWRSSARQRKLMVRQHVDASLPHSTVVLDTRTALYDAETFEAAVEVAASIVVAASGHGFPVRLLTSDGLALEAKGGRGDTALLLDRLATVAVSRDGSLAAALDLARRGRTRGSLAVVSGRVGGPDLTGLTPLQRRFDQVVVVRVGSERELPPPAAVGAAMSIDVADSAAFAAAWRQRVGR